MKWLDYKTITKELILKVEQKLQIKLPDDYKQIALKYDGGYPEPSHFKIGEQVEIFNNLLSLDEREYGNVYEILDDLNDRLRNNLVPFGEDAFGNLLCFDYSNNGSIVFWEHEKNYESFKEVTFICNSFSDLVESLY